jgi:hypothetical protein
MSPIGDNSLVVAIESDDDSAVAIQLTTFKGCRLRLLHVFGHLGRTNHDLWDGYASAVALQTGFLRGAGLFWEGKTRVALVVHEEPAESATEEYLAGTWGEHRVIPLQWGIRFYSLMIELSYHITVQGNREPGIVFEAFKRVIANKLGKCRDVKRLPGFIKRAVGLEARSIRRDFQGWRRKGKPECVRPETLDELCEPLTVIPGPKCCDKGIWAMTPEDWETTVSWLSHAAPCYRKPSVQEKSFTSEKRSGKKSESLASYRVGESTLKGTLFFR